MDALAQSLAVVEAPILIDSGFRRGSDILQALALGAKAVMLGRTILHGLAGARVRGVSQCALPRCRSAGNENGGCPWMINRRRARAPAQAGEQPAMCRSMKPIA